MASISKIVTANPFEISLNQSSSSLIEASAGTGKTYTLALLYLRLILNHGGSAAFGRHLAPENILVVTFTRAATAELTDRIRSRLAEAALVFRAEEHELDSFDPALVQLRNEIASSGGESLSSAAYRLSMAAIAMDDSAISTIHSFANRVLKGCMFAAAAPADYEVVESLHDLELVATQDYWRIFVSSLDEQDTVQFLSHWSSPEDLYEKAKGLIPYASEFDETAPPGELLSNARKKMVQLVSDARISWSENDTLSALESFFEDSAKKKLFNQKSLNSGHRKKIYSALREWLDSPDIFLPDIFSGSSGLRMSSVSIADIWTGDSAPACAALDAMAELYAAAKNPPTAKPAITQHCVKWIEERIKEQKTVHATITHDDLLITLRDSLQGEGGEELAEQIRKEFPVALIDEFQDTDPVQYEIFDRIYSVADTKDGSSFLMIGDPKQSIYAFRGADVYTYFKAKKSAKHIYTLSKNFRSSPLAVKSVNNVFRTAEKELDAGAFCFAGENGNLLPYVDVEAGAPDLEMHVDGETQSALIASVSNEPMGKSEYLELSGKAAAASIAQLLNKGRDGQATLPCKDGSMKPVMPADVAVLVNNGTEASAIRKHLRDAGVPSVYLSERRSVFGSPVAAEILAILRACASPLEEALVRKALATSLFALSVSELEELIKDDSKWESIVEQFVGYRQVWLKKGVMPMISRMAFDHGVVANISLKSTQAERDLTDFFHIGELLASAEEHRDGFAATIRYLEESMNEGSENDEMQSRLETDYDLVKVITIHKSKGLEFPIVYLPYICNCRPSQSKDAPFLLHDSDGAPVLHLEACRETVATADSERLAEDVRKLYVAMTRACNFNWLGLARVKDYEKSAAARIFGLSDESDIDKQASALGMYVEQMEGFTPCNYSYITDSELDNARTAPNLRFDPWWIASYSALQLRLRGKRSIRLDVADTAKQEIALEESLSSVGDDGAYLKNTSYPGQIHSVPRGPRYGTFFHDLLEWCAEHVYVTPEGEEVEGFMAAFLDKAGRERMLARKVKACGLADHSEAINVWLEDYLSIDIPVAGDRKVKLYELKSARSEWEFWFSADHAETSKVDEMVKNTILPGKDRPSLSNERINGMMKGFIDLVFEHDHKYYIVDWKSNFLGEDDASYSLDNMEFSILDGRYDVQMIIYSIALYRQIQMLSPETSFQSKFGGVIYAFLRGYKSSNNGFYCISPSEALIEAVDREFSCNAKTTTTL